MLTLKREWNGYSEFYDIGDVRYSIERGTVDGAPSLQVWRLGSESWVCISWGHADLDTARASLALLAEVAS